MNSTKASVWLFALVLFLCATFAHSQAVRWDLGAPGSAGATTTTNSSGFPTLRAVPGVSLAWCNYPANAAPCTNYAPTYTSSTAAVSCASNTPIVLQGSSSCVATGDNFGNLGVWTLPGLYSYTTTIGGVTNGPFAVTVPAPPVVVYALPSETIAHAVARLPVGGGVVQLGTGVYQSGSVNVTTPNVTIRGVGRPTYNSQTAPTALNPDGTVIQGTVTAQQGADGFTLRDLGVDVGPAWSAANGNIVPGQAIAIYNIGQVVGAPQVQNPVYDNVACLGTAINAAAHCMIMENVNGGIIHNVTTFYNRYGIVLKGTNSVIDGTFDRGHSFDAILIKSDVYAPSSADSVSNFHVVWAAALGDTQGLEIWSNNGGNISDFEISNGDIQGTFSFAIQLLGQDGSDLLQQVVISNVVLDEEHTSGYCLNPQGYVLNVSMSDFACSNSAIGGIINTSIGTQNDFRYSNGTIQNITGVGIDTTGRSNVTGVGLINITGNAIQTENSGLTVECNNYYASIGGTGLATVGSGSYAYCAQGFEDSTRSVKTSGAWGPGSFAIATSPTCSAALEGAHMVATTCNAPCSAGSSCSTGGTTHCEMYCNSAPAWVETGR